MAHRIRTRIISLKFALLIIAALVLPYSVAALRMESVPGWQAGFLAPANNVPHNSGSGGQLDQHIPDRDLNRKPRTIGSLANSELKLGLVAFANSLLNGDPASLRGVYVPGIFELSVVQQGENGSTYVSSSDHSLTQFGLAGQFGVTGLLAHNYLSGKYFSRLEPGQIVILTYGDGHLEYFQVSEVRQYQALSPFDPYGDYRDLVTQEWVDLETLFNQVYQGEPHLTFQTCIAAEGNPSWGRMFVLALPAEAPGGSS